MPYCRKKSKENVFLFFVFSPNAIVLNNIFLVFAKPWNFIIVLLFHFNPIGLKLSRVLQFNSGINHLELGSPHKLKRTVPSKNWSSFRWQSYVSVIKGHGNSSWLAVYLEVSTTPSVSIICSNDAQNSEKHCIYGYGFFLKMKNTSQDHFSNE